MVIRKLLTGLGAALLLASVAHAQVNSSTPGPQPAPGSSVCGSSPCPPANGGTGVANTGNLTWNGAQTLSFTSGQTMTFPAASTTLAGLGTAQAFTQPQSFPVGATNATSINWGTAGTGFWSNGGNPAISVGGTAQVLWSSSGMFRATNSGAFILSNNDYFAFGAGIGSSGGDTFLTRHAAATWQLGQVDAVSPIAQTIVAQSVVAGTSNTGGGGLTLKGPLSTGSGTPGDLVLQTGTTGGSATVQNAAATALTIKGGTQVVQLNAITSDATHTDSTVCQDTTTHGLYAGSGTLGVCVGTSSVRYKRDIKPLPVGLADLMAIKPIQYFYRPGHGDNGAKLQYGVTAENMAKAIPALASNDAEGRPNTADLVGLIPVLVNAVKEQQAEIAELRGQIRQFKGR